MVDRQPADDSNPLKAVLGRSRKANAELAKAYLREQHHQPWKVSDRLHSRALWIVWIGGIVLAAFILFVLANTIGRSLLGLEENLDHHRSYQEPGS